MRAGSAAAIVPCSSVLEGIGPTPSKELCSLQSQVRDGQFSWDDGRAAAVDTGKANFWGLALTRVPGCGRARKGRGACFPLWNQARGRMGSFLDTQGPLCWFSRQNTTTLKQWVISGKNEMTLNCKQALPLGLSFLTC